MIRAALLGLLVAGRVLAAQSTILRIDDAGPGVGPRILVDALSRPYDVAPRDTGRYLVARTSDNPRTLVVLGRDVVIEGRVHGDVVVISGDLYMHPGGAIDGSYRSSAGPFISSLTSSAIEKPRDLHSCAIRIFRSSEISSALIGRSQL